jgi:hypothetical protein
MIIVRHLALMSVVSASFVALSAQPVVAAFGITSAVGATELPAWPLLGSPTPNLLPSSYEGGTPIIFREVENATVLTPGGLDVDHDGSNVVAQPTVSGNIVNPLLISSTLGVGTKFNSYMFHFDPVGSPFFAFYISTIEFDNPILGVQLFSNGFLLEKPAGTAYTGTLEQGDLEVFLNGGPPAAYYPGGVAYRGVEEDSFVLAISGNTVMIGGSASGVEIDQVRILTAPPVFGEVPEPTAAITWAIISMIALCGTARRGR